MRDRRSAAELLCLTLLLAYLAWLPLPFGSASDAAQAPLILAALGICVAASLVAMRRRELQPTRAGRLWLIGGVLFLAAIAVQLVPLPMALLRIVSPQSARLWRAGDQIAALAGVQRAALHPITIDPAATTLQLFVTAAYMATF